jgi:hypothetical protein
MNAASAQPGHGTAAGDHAQHRFTTRPEQHLPVVLRSLRAFAHRFRLRLRERCCEHGTTVASVGQRQFERSAGAELATVPIGQDGPYCAEWNSDL